MELTLKVLIDISDRAAALAQMFIEGKAQRSAPAPTPPAPTPPETPEAPEVPATPVTPVEPENAETPAETPAEDAATPTAQPDDSAAENAERAKGIVKALRKRLMGDDYEDRKGDAAVDTLNRAITRRVKQIAVSLGADKPSELPNAEAVDRFAAMCAAIRVEDGKLTEDAPF